jgi:hypothetical protein
MGTAQALRLAASGAPVDATDATDYQIAAKDYPPLPMRPLALRP